MDRKSFLQKSALGYSGLVVGGLAVNPMETPSKPSDLKITDIRAVVLAANYDYSIIKIYTNQGIVGLGEVRDAGWPAQALMMKPYLIGKNPLDIEPILKSVSHLTGNGRFGGGYSAIDIALMDIAGKVWASPAGSY
jgi:L-alanine-DL-glutamate epimerase-like enolase superfamily enzyme